MTRVILLIGAGLCAVASTQGTSPDTWTFGRLDRIGGHATTVIGSPRVVETSVGKAIEFDGVDDAVFVDVHPLAGATTFTWEAIFRPDGGNPEQRWFHLQENGSENRMLFEIRVVGDRWFLDSFNQSTTGSATLMNKSSLHPLGAWYHVAAVYDGKLFTNYVNGVKDGEVEVALSPQGPGRSSMGVRINQVYYFKGAIHSARFTRRALAPSEFLKLPDVREPRFEPLATLCAPACAGTRAARVVPPPSPSVRTTEISGPPGLHNAGSQAPSSRSFDDNQWR